MLSQSPDGTIKNAAGKILHERTHVWAARIMNQQRCFVCGDHKNAKPFNDEHVIPDWVLRRFDLQDKRATLPNGTTIPYRQYKVPCCEDCNSILGKSVEKPISEITSGGINAVVDYIKQEGPYLFCLWLSLLYFKLHYKDLTLSAYRNPNEGNGFIGDAHDWEEMHHVHTLATAPYTRAIVRSETIGTFGVFPGWSMAGGEQFDFCDVSPARTIMVRLGSVVLFHNISDACGLASWFANYTSGIGALSEVQARELCVRLAFGELLLQNRPKHVVRQSREYPDAIEITSVHDLEPRFDDSDPLVFGAILQSKLQDYSQLIHIPGKIGSDALKEVAIGKVTFLWDEQGNFRNEAQMRAIQPGG